MPFQSSVSYSVMQGVSYREGGGMRGTIILFIKAKLQLGADIENSPQCVFVLQQVVQVICSYCSVAMQAWMDIHCMKVIVCHCIVNSHTEMA